MSSTRHTEDEGQLFENRYASDPAYATNGGIQATATAKKAMLPCFAGYRRDLLFFLQGLSLEIGGAHNLALAIIDEFPKRFVAALKKPAAEVWNGVVGEVDEDFTGRSEAQRENDELRERALSDWKRFFTWPTFCGQPIHGMDLAADSRRESEFKTALQKAWEPKRKDYNAEALREACMVYAKPLELFLRELCVNPRLGFYKLERREICIESDKRDRRLMFPGDEPWRVASLPYFHDITEALLEFVANWQQRIQRDFVLTNIGRRVQKTLKASVDNREMVMVCGREGRGKTEAAKTWVLANLHRARLVKLTADTDKGDFYRAICKACGLPMSHSLNPKQMKSRVEDFLQATRLCIVVDEAHFALGQSRRIYKNPELLDWLDTALVNYDVPVALVTTPQFNVYLGRVATQMNYNVEQFRRRLKQSQPLDEFTDEASLEAIARKLLAGSSERGISAALDHVRVNRDRDVSGLGDLVREARRFATKRNSQVVSDDDISRATQRLGIHEKHLRAMVQPEPSLRARRRHAIPDAEPVQLACNVPTRDTLPPSLNEISPGQRASNDLKTVRPTNSRAVVGEALLVE